MIIQIINFLLCVGSDHSKDKLQLSLQWHYNDNSNYEFSLVCNRSKKLVLMSSPGGIKLS